MRYTFALLLAILVGLSLGLIGGGGSILAVPILKYVVGVTAREAIAMSLFIVGIVSVVGLIPHWQQGNVNLPVAMTFIPPAMVGAFLGAKLSRLPFITDTIQMGCFGVVMALASFFMIKKSNSQKTGNADKNPPLSEKPPTVVKKIVLTIFQGLGVGILTGFVGVGGGFLIIPSLVLIGGIPMKEAVGTSLLIIATNAFSGFLGYWGQVALNWTIMISFSLAASCGIVFGANLAKKIQAKSLQKAFGYFVLAVAIFVLIAR